MPVRAYADSGRGFVLSKIFAAIGESDAVETPVYDCYSLQVSSLNGAQPTLWLVELVLSNDDLNYGVHLTHSQAAGEVDGEMLATGADRFPARFFKIRVSSLTLGPSSGILVTATGR